MKLSFREAAIIQRVLAGREFGADYPTDLKTVAAGSSIQGTAQIQAGLDFVAETCTTVVLYATTRRAVNYSVDPPPRIVISDSASVSALMNREDNPVENISGSILFPYVFRIPLLFRQTTTINVTWFNINTSLAYVVQTAFHGYHCRRGA